MPNLIIELHCAALYKAANHMFEWLHQLFYKTIIFVEKVNLTSPTCWAALKEAAIALCTKNYVDSDVVYLML